MGIALYTNAEWSLLQKTLYARRSNLAILRGQGGLFNPKGTKQAQEDYEEAQGISNDIIAGKKYSDADAKAKETEVEALRLRL